MAAALSIAAYTLHRETKLQSLERSPTYAESRQQLQSRSRLASER